MLLEIIDFTQCDKELINRDIGLYCEFWNNMYDVLHTPEVNISYLKKHIIEIKVKAISGFDSKNLKIKTKCHVEKITFC